MRIELKDKGTDRGVTLHFFPNEWDCEEGARLCGVIARNKVRKLLSEFKENGIACFLQGDQDDWMMIEFWTGDIDTIIGAVEMAERTFRMEAK